MIAREAAEAGFDVGLDFEGLERVAAHFRDQASLHGKPLGRPVNHEPSLARHQVPGGMRSNLENQLQALGLRDRLPHVLDEISQIREELGWPIMVTPISQFVGVQALFNVIEGERYRTVQADLANYVLGLVRRGAGYGGPGYPRPARRGTGAHLGTPRARLSRPSCQSWKRRRGRSAPMKSVSQPCKSHSPCGSAGRPPAACTRADRSRERRLATLLSELTHRPAVNHVFLRKGNTTFNYRS